MPFHWGGASNANALTDPALDPHSKMPEFKVCAVALTRVGGPDDTELLTTVPGPTGRRPVRRCHAAARQPFRHPPTRRLSRQRPPTTKDARMHTKNRFLQGIYQFTGAGIDKPAPLDAELELRRAGRLGRPGAVLPRRQHLRRAGRRWC